MHPLWERVESKLYIYKWSQFCGFLQEGNYLKEIVLCISFLGTGWTSVVMYASSLAQCLSECCVRLCLLLSQLIGFGRFSPGCHHFCVSIITAYFPSVQLVASLMYATWQQQSKAKRKEMYWELYNVFDDTWICWEMVLIRKKRDLMAIVRDSCQNFVWILHTSSKGVTGLLP